jgi:hypothetical protein
LCERAAACCRETQPENKRTPEILHRPTFRTSNHCEARILTLSRGAFTS